jgi:hypothetical protein
MELLQEYQFRLEHQHGDGSWSELVEDHSHHDAAAHDPERGWVQRIFRCTTCPELVAMRSREKTPAPDAE